MDQLKGLILQAIMKAVKLKRLKISMDWISIQIKWVNGLPTYLMKVYLGKLCVSLFSSPRFSFLSLESVGWKTGQLCVSSNLIQCKSAIHVICLSFLETCARPPVTPDRAFNVIDSCF